MTQSRCIGLSLLAAALSASCSLAGLDLSSVDVVIPSIPPAWAGLAGIELVLVWRDSAGDKRREFASPGESRAIKLPQGLRRAIIVEAWYRGRPLRPAGALWPDDLTFSSGSRPAPFLKIRWFEGWTASVLLALDNAGEGHGIDLARLDLEARARLSDPWLVDPARVALAIRERTFRSDFLISGAMRELALPPGGPWIAESPFASEPILREGEWVALMATGSHRWYSRDLELFVAVPEAGDAVMLVRSID
ncbi:MAG TPA: hypothetical protein VMV83_08955 [Rectinemataceae bacterium]|nr:hypothetical protein [Rectinemataceae bacterium]